MKPVPLLFFVLAVLAALVSPLAMASPASPPPIEVTDLAHPVANALPIPRPSAAPSPVAMSVPVPSPQAPPLKPTTQVEFDHFEESTLYFRMPGAGDRLSATKTELHDLKYIGALRASGEDAGAPAYFLFSGKSCRSCQQDPSIYALRPGSSRPTAYVYPGKILDNRSRALVLESRAFFGKCIYRHPETVYVVFQKERVDRHGLQASVLIAEPGNDHMEERLIERHLPRLQDTLKLAKGHGCYEVDGRNRLTLSHPLDVKSRNGDEADDDDETKENQTDEDLPVPEPLH